MPRTSMAVRLRELGNWHFLSKSKSSSLHAAHDFTEKATQTILCTSCINPQKEVVLGERAIGRREYK